MNASTDITTDSVNSDAQFNHPASRAASRPSRFTRRRRLFAAGSVCLGIAMGSVAMANPSTAAAAQNVGCKASSYGSATNLTIGFPADKAPYAVQFQLETRDRASIAPGGGSSWLRSPTYWIVNGRATHYLDTSSNTWRLTTSQAGVVPGATVASQMTGLVYTVTGSHDVGVFWTWSRDMRTFSEWAHFGGCLHWLG